MEIKMIIYPDELETVEQLNEICTRLEAQGGTWAIETKIHEDKSYLEYRFNWGKITNMGQI